ncbi:MAG: rhodanese-like domain-containing protein [Gammaproteobacteria bacterium]|nr:rhodanese-like domain-containing protein [Gammaproteobacteria bacterium]
MKLTGLQTFITLLSLLAVTVSAQVLAETNPFPHRDKFKDVKVMEMEVLKATAENVTIVDVRSRYEYDTLHIKGAVNIPLNSDSFGQSIADIQKAEGKQIVFYCNGGKCKKSYEAVQKARKAGVADCIAYDAGIYAWAQKVPEQSVLLGKTPMRSADFIDNDRFKSRLIDARTFEAKKSGGGLILDIRDRAQRDTQVFPFEEERAELREIDRIKQIIDNSRKQGKTLLVYDKVGKQVRWFQYLLERQGVKNYYFMKGGSEGYYEEKLGKFRFDQAGG